MLLSAQANPSGIPDELIEAKKEELRQQKVPGCSLKSSCTDGHRLKQKRTRSAEKQQTRVLTLNLARSRTFGRRSVDSGTMSAATTSGEAGKDLQGAGEEEVEGAVDVDSRQDAEHQLSATGLLPLVAAAGGTLEETS